MTVTYGQVFKELRESRNMKMKDVAEGIISTQTLRRFEAGETNVTIDVLMQLLQRIVVDSIDFMYKYATEGGEMTGINPVLEAKIQEYEMIRDVSGAISYCKEYLKKENPSLYDRLWIMGYINNKIMYSPDSVSAILQENERLVLEHLNSIDDYYSADYALITGILNSKSENQFFSQEFVQICLEKILAKKHFPVEHELGYFLEVVERHLLLAGIAWLSRQGEYELAESYCLRSIESLQSNRRATVDGEIINNYAALSQIQLRQNKVEGVELANKVVAFYDARIALTHENYKIDKRRDFVNYVYQLNKTGVDFNF